MNAGAVDIDVGDVLSYTWTATPANVGAFADASAASTTFTCWSSGSVELSAAVSDGICGDMREGALVIDCGEGGAGGSAGGGTGGGASF